MSDIEGILKAIRVILVLPAKRRPNIVALQSGVTRHVPMVKQDVNPGPSKPRAYCTLDKMGQTLVWQRDSLALFSDLPQATVPTQKAKLPPTEVYQKVVRFSDIFHYFWNLNYYFSYS